MLTVGGNKSDRLADVNPLCTTLPNKARGAIPRCKLAIGNRINDPDWFLHTRVAGQHPKNEGGPDFGIAAIAARPTARFAEAGASLARALTGHGKRSHPPVVNSYLSFRIMRLQRAKHGTMASPVCSCSLDEIGVFGRLPARAARVRASTNRQRGCRDLPLTGGILSPTVLQTRLLADSGNQAQIRA